MPAIRNGEQLLLVSGEGDMTIGYGGLVDDTADATELVVNIATEPHKVGDFAEVGSLRERTEGAILRMQFGSLDSLEVFLAQGVILWNIMAAKQGVEGNATPVSYIEAADDMYAAIEGFLSTHDAVLDICKNPIGTHEDAVRVDIAFASQQNAISELRAAFAKARGEEAPDASR